MLTPDDMQKRIFALGRKLENNDVGMFVKEVQINYQFLFDQVEEQKKQIKGMESKLGHYRKIESSLQEALVSAERVSENKIQEAEKKSRQIEKTAYKKADEILDDAKRELAHIKGLIADFENDYKSYQDKYFEFVQGQISFIEEAKNFILEEKINIDENKSVEDKDKVIFEDKLSSNIKLEDVMNYDNTNNENKEENKEEKNETDELKNASVEIAENSEISSEQNVDNIKMEDAFNERKETFEQEKEDIVQQNIGNKQITDNVGNEKINTQSDVIDETTIESNNEDSSEENLEEVNIASERVEQSNEGIEDLGMSGSDMEDSTISDSDIHESDIEINNILQASLNEEVNDSDVVSNDIDLDKDNSFDNSSIYDSSVDLLSQGIVNDQKIPDDFKMPTNIPNFDEVPDFNIPNSVVNNNVNKNFNNEPDLGQKISNKINTNDVFELPDIDLDFPEFKDETSVSDRISNDMVDSVKQEAKNHKEADVSMNENVELKYANDSFLSGLKKKKNEKESFLASLNLSSNKDDSRDRIKNMERSYTKDLLESNKALLKSDNIEKSDKEPSLPKNEEMSHRRSLFAMQSERK